MALCFAAMLGLHQPASAAIDSCSLSTTGITYSAYNPTVEQAVDSTGTITVTCSGGGSAGTEKIYLTLTGGNNGSCSPREMRSGANPLVYDVFTDASFSNLWCSTNPNRVEVPVAFSGGGSSTYTAMYPMYGRVRSGQNPAFGDYQDTLIATLTTDSLAKLGTPYATTSVPIRGSVARTCLVSAGTLAFGNYNAMVTSPLDSSAALTVTCTKDTPYFITLGGGQNLSGTTRRMVGSSSNFLSYQLFADAARTQAWGDGTALGSTVPSTATGNDQGFQVYGRVPPGQPTAPGVVSDQVQVNVVY